jgi:hypothetical protein
MRIVKKLIIYTTIIGASLFSILVVFGFIYQDEVVSSVQTEMNKHLNAKIKADKIELSLISHFPLATINLTNVVGFESKNFSSNPDTLFSFQRFSLSFNVFEIMTGSYVLNRIQAEEGFLNLEIDKKGQGNYWIIKSDSSESSNFKFDLERVNLKNCEVGFRDFNSKDKYAFYFPNIISKGSFTDKQINTALYGSADVRALILDGTSYLQNESTSLDIGVEINLETGTFQVSRGYITLRNEFQFDVKGKTDQGAFHYTFESKNLDLAQIESLIPAKHIEFITAYQLAGDVAVFIDIERKENAKFPKVTGDFTIKNGQLKYIETGVSVQVSQAKGSFDLGAKASPLTTQISIPDFTLTTKEAKAVGSLAISNLRHPRYKIVAKGKANLLEVSKLATLGENFEMAGDLGFNINMQGAVQEMDSIIAKDIKTIRGTAELVLENGSFGILNVPDLKDISAEIKLNQNVAVFEKFNGLAAGSATKGKVKITNWLGFILGKSQSLDMEGNVAIERLVVADWASSEKEQDSDFSFPKQITFKGLVDIGEFKNENLVLTNVKTYVNLGNNAIAFRHAHFSGFNGEVLTDFEMKEELNQISYKGSLSTKRVNMRLLMESFNDFGQTSLKSDQINGELNSHLSFEFNSNKALKINEPSIYVDGDVMLLKGELIEYKLLYDIPKEIESNKVIALFVNLDKFEKRLHHIKFDTISNHVTIKNSLITIPRMEIHSSALAISVQGTHSFDNRIDYFMNFNLNHVLSKNEPITSEYGFIEDGENGGRMIYLHVYTKNGEVEVDLDKNGSKKHKETKVSDEMNVAKSVLKEELGFFKNDTSVLVVDEPETFDFDIDLGEFSDSLTMDSTAIKGGDTVITSADSSIFGKILKKKTKKKKKKEDNFEEWDFEDDDY